MEKQDFVDIYHLRGLRERLPKAEDGKKPNLRRLLRDSLSLRTQTGDYEVGRNDGLYKIRFSTDSYLERHFDSFVLAPLESFRLLKKLFHIPKNPFISLAYSFDYRSGFITIYYIQSTNRMTHDIYSSLDASLGVNPHEFILANFIARLQPTLDSNPKIDVKIHPEYVDKKVYPKLRDRFFDKSYSLNSHKERVIQTLGEESPWIKSRK